LTSGDRPAAPSGAKGRSLRRFRRDEHDGKARDQKRRQAEHAARIEQHPDGDDTVRTTQESLIFVASQGADPSELSKIGEERRVFKALAPRRH
jgi:hypothetical protein